MKQELSLRQHELKSYLRRLLAGNNLPYKENKFILLCHYRSGSTLLANLLNDHPRIYCDGELFLPFVKLNFKKVFLPYTYINYHTYIKYNSSKNKKTVYGFDLKISQLIDILLKSQGSPEDFLWKLHQDGWKIIYLQRLNIFRQVVSNLVAQSRGKWHEKHQEKLQRSQVSIDLKELMQQLKRYDNNLVQAQKMLQKLPYCEITYESDLLNADNHQNTLDRIFDYLGVESVPIKAQLKKVSQKSLDQDIENYQEVVDFISQTNYAKFLESD
ncbi:MAG: hypothetical protein SW833_26270 [Cyanobacteriota bacterium]|nr:hypothetical protein [Cyanobacteriota bacterium]